MSDTGCTICLENFTEHEICTTLPCGHKFHSNCLASWLWKDQSCPNCRLKNKANASDDEIDFSETLRQFVIQYRLRKNAIQKSIRRAKREDADSLLVRKRKEYEKIKNKIKTRHLEEVQIINQLREREKYARKQRRFLYTEYLKKYNDFNKEHRKQNSLVLKERRRVVCALNGSKIRLNIVENRLAELSGWVNTVE